MLNSMKESLSFWPFLVVYNILSETETWHFLRLLLRMTSSEMQYKLGIRRVQVNSEQNNWIGCYYRPNRHVYGVSFTCEYLRHRTISNKVKVRCFML